MPTELPPEGSLAADTQRFTRGATRKSIIDKDARPPEGTRRRHLVAPCAGPADRRRQRIRDLASIVEKETGRGDERSRVAAVFINRLRKNMRLQSDPTIIYGLFGGAGKPEDRPIYQSDIRQADALQHLYDQRPAADAHRQPVAGPRWRRLPTRPKTNDLYFVADGTVATCLPPRWTSTTRTLPLSCHSEAAGGGGREGRRSCMSAAPAVPAAATEGSTAQ